MIDFAMDKLLYLATRLCSARHPRKAYRIDDGQFSYFVRGRSVQLRIYFRSLVDWVALHSLKRADFYKAILSCLCHCPY
jgi:hypothetical protein